jgi:hypothetical protein
MNKLSPLYFLVVILLASIQSFAQDCMPEALATKKGTWKQGIAGSVRNVTAAELAKEKTTLNNIHKMIAGTYTPTGAQALHAYTFSGPDTYSGKNWIAGSFGYSIYVLRYFCDLNSADKTKFIVNPSTATTLNITANVIRDLNTLYPAQLADDDPRGYLKLARMPVKKDGFYFMGEEVVGDSHLPKKIKEYRWLVTYNDTLPFYYVSRKEYLELVKHKLEKTIKENGNSSGYYTAFLDNIDNWMKRSAAELSQPAICLWNDEERFTGFTEEGTKGSFIAVKPNMAYYHKKLPRSVPQFFYVVYKVAEASDVEVSNMNAIKNAIDFGTLRKMLGK